MKLKKLSCATWGIALCLTCSALGIFTFGAPQSFASATEEEGVYVGGVLVTNENKNNITGTGLSGKISYDFQTNALTLENAVVSSSYVVEITNETIPDAQPPEESEPNEQPPSEPETENQPSEESEQGEQSPEETEPSVQPPEEPTPEVETKTEHYAIYSPSALTVLFRGQNLIEGGAVYVNGNLEVRGEKSTDFLSVIPKEDISAELNYALGAQKLTVSVGNFTLKTATAYGLKLGVGLELHKKVKSAYITAQNSAVMIENPDALSLETTFSGAPAQLLGEGSTAQNATEDNDFLQQIKIKPIENNSAVLSVDGTDTTKTLRFTNSHTHQWSGEWTVTDTHHYKTCATPTSDGGNAEQEICYCTSAEPTPLTNYGEHDYPADDGDCATPIICTACAKISVEAKTHTLVLKGDKDATHHTFECTNEGCNHEEDALHDFSQQIANETYLEKPADCMNKAKYFYSCLCGRTNEVTFESGEVDATAHAWGAPTYTWETGNAKCTAKRICEQNSSHAEMETVDTVAEVTQALSCGKDELTTFTATFTMNIFTAQVKEKVQTQTALAHDYSGNYSTDKEGHWHVCKNCKLAETKENHSSNIPQPTEAESKYCLICKYVIAPALGHTHRFTEELHYDETGHWHKCAGCEEIDGKNLHVPNQAQATEDSAKFCTVCLYVIEPALKHEHIFSQNYLADDTGHWHKCMTCNAIDKKEKHDCDFDDGDCTTPVKCTVCKHTLIQAMPTHTLSQDYLLANATAEKHYRVCASSGCTFKDEGEAHTFNQEHATELAGKYCVKCKYVAEPQLGHTHLFEEIPKTNSRVSEATCLAKAVYYKSCACGQLSEEKFTSGEVNLSNHTSVSFLYASNGDGTHLKKHACCRALANGQEPCNGPTPTCTVRSVCTLCSQSFGELLPHNYIIPKHDAKEHWRRCSACEAITDKFTHEYPIWSEWSVKFDGSQSKNAQCECGFQVSVTAEVNDGITSENLAQEAILRGTNLSLTAETNEQKIGEQSKNAIQRLIGEKQVKFWDISITNLLSNYPVHATNTVLELVLEYDLENKEEVALYRYHDDTAQKLRALTARPSEGFEDGTFYLDTENGLIYIYSSQFSTYAVAYDVFSIDRPLELVQYVYNNIKTVILTHPNTTLLIVGICVGVIFVAIIANAIAKKKGKRW